MKGKELFITPMKEKKSNRNVYNEVDDLVEDMVEAKLK